MIKKEEEQLSTVKNLIYMFRGQQVMLDSDLASLYQVETKRLNEAVKRNIARFPEEFRFQLTEEEYDLLRSQNATSINHKNTVSSKGGRRYLPFVFTEQGIAMLSAILKSDIAVQVSINIMKVFVEMRKIMANHSILFEQINRLELKQIEYKKEIDTKLDKVFDYISENTESSQKIFFDGQIFDAFSLLVKLINSANSSIILIDNYIDINTLNILAKKKKHVNICIYTLKKTRLTKTDVENFNKQYPELIVKYTDTFHDRFLIIDENTAYHIGASLKDAGKKCFAISLLEDSAIINSIREHLKIQSIEQTSA